MKNLATQANRVSSVFTEDQQKGLTPSEALNMLREGNKRYVADQLTNFDHMAQVKKTTGGQHPKAIVLSCVDSRAPVEEIFDQSVGDIFVARVAGNFVNTDILGSMEFACGPAKSKLVLVLGHQHCGAIKAAADTYGSGSADEPAPHDNLMNMVKALRQPVDETAGFEGERNSKNSSFVDAVVKKNVQITIDKIRSDSPALAKLEKDGEIAIHGGVYSLTTGEVDFF